MQLQVQLPLCYPGFQKRNLKNWLFVVLEDRVENREKSSKAYDAIIDRQRYMNDKPEKIIILKIFSLKKVKTVLSAWLELNEMVENTINKAQDMIV